MLELLIVVLLVLWLLGYFGPARLPSIPNTGSAIHTLLVDHPDPHHPEAAPVVRMGKRPVAPGAVPVPNR